MLTDKNLKMTGERVVPDDIQTYEEYIQLLRHQFVYEYVKRQLKKDDRVLEIGFGEGYGTNKLAYVCREIIGIDVEKRVVDYANKKYGNNKCSFKWYEGYNLPFADNSFDVIITFQVIEHIEDDVHFVQEIHRVLRDKGKCMLTTPNREIRLRPGQKPWNRFHKKEYSAYQLSQILSCSFKRVDILGLVATDDIMKLEAKRIHQGFFLNIAIKLGLRKLIPEKIDPYIARLVGKLKGHKTIDNQNRSFKNKYSTDNFWLTNETLSDCLDLYAQCIKHNKD